MKELLAFNSLKSFFDNDEHKIISNDMEWWYDKYEKLINLEIPYEDWKVLIKDDEDFVEVYNSTAKHKTLYLLNMYSVEDVDNIIKEYS